MRNRGQALIELLLSVPVVAITVLWAASLYRAAWDRFECSHRAFEAARAALNGIPSFSTRVMIYRTTEGWRATARCGSATESVELLHLENWDD